RRRIGKHGARLDDAVELESTTADRATEPVLPDQHLNTSVARRRTAGLRDGDEDAGLAGPQQRQCLVEPAHRIAGAHSATATPWRGAGAGCASRLRNSSTANSTRSGVAGASRTKK